MSQFEDRLVTRDFEAWDYGPVEPDLYQKLKAYGSSNIADIFFEEPYEEATDGYSCIKYMIDRLGDATSRRLVAITHREGGAWAKCYQSGIPGITIPDRLILEEYNDRVKKSGFLNPILMNLSVTTSCESTSH